MAAAPIIPPARSSGCLLKMGVLFVAAVVIGMIAAIYFVSQPQSLDDIDGLDPAAANRGRDISQVLTESVDRQIPATLTEAEINQWLARTLKVEQGGRLAEHAEFKRVAVRLREGIAEIVMEREIAGQPFTTSMFISISQRTEGHNQVTDVNLHGGAYPYWLAFPPRGGRFGSLVVPQGFLRIVMPDYMSLADVLESEIENGFKRMSSIKIGEKKIEFDPRLPTIERGGDRE